jgi:hypothetical protein
MDKKRSVPGCNIGKSFFEKTLKFFWKISILNLDFPEELKKN